MPPKACNCRYYLNYRVIGNERQYYEGIPQDLHSDEHAVISMDLCDWFGNQMCFGQCVLIYFCIMHSLWCALSIGFRQQTVPHCLMSNTPRTVGGMGLSGTGMLLLLQLSKSGVLSTPKLCWLTVIKCGVSLYLTTTAHKLIDSRRQWRPEMCDWRQIIMMSGLTPVISALG